MFLTHSRTSVDRELSDLSNKRLKKKQQQKKTWGLPSAKVQGCQPDGTDSK